MAQLLKHETIQNVVGKLARHEIDEKVVDDFLSRRVRQSREQIEPSVWSLIKRYVRRNNQSHASSR